MEHLRNQEGSSLIELVVGGVIALIVVGAIISLQIDAYRYQHADSSRYEVQLEAANGLERIVQEVRSATQVSLSGAECSGVLSLNADGVLLVYSRDPDSRRVMRSDPTGSRVIGEQVDCLAFREDRGTLEVTWTGAPANGSAFTLRSTVSPRVTTN